MEGPPRIRSEIDRLAGTIELLSANGVDRASVTRLEAELHGIRQAVAETSEPQRIERLSEAVAVLGRQMAEMRLSQVGRPDFTDLKSDLDDIRAELKQAGAAREHSDVPGALHGLGQQIAGLAERVSVRQAGPEETERLARVVDRLSEEISAIAEHLRAAPKDVHESLERIEDGLRQIGAETETVNIELMLRAVQERLDRAPMTATALQGLEAQIAALTAKLDSSGTADPLQSVIDETLTQVRTLRDEADHIAERAARAALREVLHHLPQAGPQADFDALKQGFTELKALHTVADKKTQQTLKAVHNALETLLNRLPPAMPAGMQPPAAPEAPEAAPTAEPSSDAAPAVRLEAAVRKLHAAAISQVEEVTAASIEASSGRPVQDSAPEEVLLEPGTPRAGAAAGSGASFTTLKDAEPADVRASFIAAARRAARAAQAEKEGPQTRGGGGRIGGAADLEPDPHRPHSSDFRIASPPAAARPGAPRCRGRCGADHVAHEGDAAAAGLAAGRKRAQAGARQSSQGAADGTRQGVATRSRHTRRHRQPSPASRILAGPPDRGGAHPRYGRVRRVAGGLAGVPAQRRRCR